jgi:hypothetical protein
MARLQVEYQRRLCEYVMAFAVSVSDIPILLRLRSLRNDICRNSSPPTRLDRSSASVGIQLFGAEKLSRWESPTGKAAASAAA